MFRQLALASSLAVGALFSGAYASETAGYPKAFLMEELTGTWCGYCPIGTATMEYLQATWGDRFIGIAIHGSGSKTDPMQIAGKQYLNDICGAFGLNSFPSAVINRSQATDEPYLALGVFEAMEADTAPQKVEIEEVVFNPEAGRDVSVVVSVTSAADVDDLKANVSVVCVENDVQGDSQLYAQLTYYHKKYGAYTTSELKSAYPEVYPYLEMYVTGEADAVYSGGKYYFYVPASIMKYQDVARGVFPSFEGVDCGGAYAAGVKRTFRIDFEMPSSVLLDSNTAMVALLTDPRDGSLINAAKLHASDYSPVSGVKTHSSSDDNQTAYYTLSGLRVDNPSSGIFIEKRGSATRKIILP